MEIIVSMVCGIIVGASGTFVIGFMVFLAVKFSTEEDKFTLFAMIKEKLANPIKTESEETIPKAKNGRRKKSK